MYTLSIIATVVLSPPQFLYHFFMIPINLFFLEFYFMIMYIIAVIKHFIGW